jgi:hypothetical protein
VEPEVTFHDLPKDDWCAVAPQLEWNAETCELLALFGSSRVTSQLFELTLVQEQRFNNICHANPA